MAEFSEEIAKILDSCGGEEKITAEVEFLSLGPVKLGKDLGKGQEGTFQAVGTVQERYSSGGI